MHHKRIVLDKHAIKRIAKIAKHNLAKLIGAPLQIALVVHKYIVRYLSGVKQALWRSVYPRQVMGKGNGVVFVLYKCVFCYSVPSQILLAYDAGPIALDKAVLNSCISSAPLQYDASTAIGLL